MSFRNTIKILYVTIFGLLPPLVVGQLLNATPIEILRACSYTGILLVLFLLSQPSVRSFQLRIICKVLVIVMLILGTGYVVVLLNVSQRSLAEVWFTLVRQGKAQGFFSRFATELIALLSSGCALVGFWLGFLAGISSTLGLLGLARGLLYAQTDGFIIAFVCCGIMLLAGSRNILGKPLNIGEGGKTQKTRSAQFLRNKQTKLTIVEYIHSRRAILRQLFSLLCSIIFTLSIALVATLGIAVVTKSTTSVSSFKIIDFTPLVLRYAPNLPVLLNVPGYESNIGSSRFPSHLALSSLPLFEVTGKSEETLYFATHGYHNYLGYGWELLQIKDSELKDILLDSSRNIERKSGESNDSEGVPLFFLGEQYTYSGYPSIDMTLVGEFYDRFPILAGTRAIAVLDWRTVGSETQQNEVARLEKPVTINYFEGIRWGTPILKGTKIRLWYEKQDGIPAGDPLDFLDPGPDPHGRLHALGIQWKGKSPEALAQYLEEEYQYSPETGEGKPELALERFLFEDRKGFCLHFASAFVVLSRHAGFPARLIEGFRITLDKNGRGTIRGTNAHAWAEVYCDGRWIRFDPTPALHTPQKDHYENVAPKGTETVSASIQKRRQIVFNIIGILACTCLCIACIFLIKRVCSPYYTLRRKARRYIRTGQRNGIPGPEYIGWTGWTTAMLEHDIPHVEEIPKLVDAIMRQTFSPHKDT